VEPTCKLNGKRITNVLLFKSSTPLVEVQMSQSVTHMDKIIGLNRPGKLKNQVDL